MNTVKYKLKQVLEFIRAWEWVRVLLITFACLASYGGVLYLRGLEGWIDDGFERMFDNYSNGAFTLALIVLWLNYRRFKHVPFGFPIALLKLYLFLFALVFFNGFFGNPLAEEIRRMWQDEPVKLSAFFLAVWLMIGFMRRIMPVSDARMMLKHGKAASLTDKPVPVFSERDKRCIAYHEAGHALVTVLLPQRETLASQFLLSALPHENNGAHGFLQLPATVHFLKEKACLEFFMLMYLGGREAEYVMTGSYREGCVSDIGQWQNTAAAYLSNQMGVFFYAEPKEEEQKAHNMEVYGDLMNGQRRVLQAFFTENRAVLQQLADTLLRQGTMKWEEVEPFIERTVLVEGMKPLLNPFWK